MRISDWSSDVCSSDLCRIRLLTFWQNEAYAAQYRSFLQQLDANLRAHGIADAEPLIAEIARGLGKIMAYKDEYGVARLYSLPAFRAGLADTFQGRPRQIGRAHV